MADISSNNGRVNIGAYSSAGHAVIAIKATEGTGYVNPFHYQQCADAHRAGLSVVHYHFCRPGSGNIRDEIHNFRNTYLKGWQNGDYACFDLEVSAGLNLHMYAQTICNIFSQLTGHKPILYSYKSFIEEHLTGVRFPGNMWWVAKYSNGQPVLPRGLTLFAWQYTDGSAGPEPHYYTGIGKCDGSIVNQWIASKLWINKLKHRRRH